MKTLDDARRLRSRILLAFEMADQEPDPARRAAWLTFAIVGAGPTGVELAGQIALLAHRVLRHEYRRAEPRHTRVVLLDGAPRVLGAFAPHLSEHARNALEDLGVSVTLESQVVDIDDDGVTVSNGDGHTQRIDAQDRGLGGGRAGLAAGGAARRPERCEARSRGAAGGRSRPDAFRAARRVRDRRHDLAPGRARHRAARDPGGEVRRAGDPSSPAGRGAVRRASPIATLARWR